MSYLCLVPDWFNGNYRLAEAAGDVRGRLDFVSGGVCGLVLARYQVVPSSKQPEVGIFPFIHHTLDEWIPAMNKNNGLPLQFVQ
jgi:hypothetical protein